LLFSSAVDLLIENTFIKDREAFDSKRYVPLQTRLGGYLANYDVFEPESDFSWVPAHRQSPRMVTPQATGPQNPHRLAEKAGNVLLMTISFVKCPSQVT
jgi:hypothetical protein